MDYKTYEVLEYENGDRRWFNKAGKLHRVDGPTVEYACGGISYFFNDTQVCDTLYEYLKKRYNNIPNTIGEDPIYDAIYETIKEM